MFLFIIMQVDDTTLTRGSKIYKLINKTREETNENNSHA